MFALAFCSGTLLTHLELERDIEQTLGKHITIPLSDYIVGILDLGSVELSDEHISLCSYYLHLVRSFSHRCMPSDTTLFARCSCFFAFIQWRTDALRHQQCDDG
jgi:hypothetical protein